MNQLLDSAKLDFSAEAIWALNLCLAIIMYGVALELKVSDFKRIIKAPKPALLGIFSQFIVLPALTFLLIYIAKPQASIALGMILIAACPGGNISNFMSHISGGNAALSVTLTAFSTVLCVFLTPFNLQFWGSLYPPTNEILKEVNINPFDVFQTIVIILGIPLILGMITNSWKPKTSAVLSKVLKPLSIIIFIAFVVIAFTKNFDLFTEYVHLVIIIVFFHNAIALASGYSIGKLGGLNVADRRTLAVETGIQNSGLGLLLIFTFFDGLGGMAIVAGWWGIWHIVAGLSIAYIWSRKKNTSAAL